MHTIQEIADRIGESPVFVKGGLWGRGTKFHQVGIAICVSDQDAEDFVKFYKTTPVPVRKGKSKPIAATV